MKKILITGFKPFLTYKINPTELIVSDLLKEGYDGIVFDVTYKEIDEFILKNKYRNYDFIISLGLAGKRNKISLENFAYNEINNKYKDNIGETKNSLIIDKNGPDKLKTNLNLNKLKSMFDYTYISDDPGRYLCNYLYYNLLLKMNANALFIHIPSFKSEGDEEKYYTQIKSIVDYIITL